jgi:hypothetical protein
VAPLRAVAWDESTHVMIFPPFTEFPDLHEIAKKDLRNYVSTGNNIGTSVCGLKLLVYEALIAKKDLRNYVSTGNNIGVVLPPSATRVCGL